MKPSHALLALLLATPLLAAEPLPIPVVKPVLRAVQSQTKFVFFECRGNELFHVDRDALAAQAANANYTVDPAFITATGMLRLQPKKGVHGETVADLSRPDSQYRKLLAKLKPTTSALLFFQREDSADILQRAQQIAQTAGFETAVMPLPKDNPIMFNKEN